MIMFGSFSNLLQFRRAIRSSPNTSNLNQGTTLPGVSLSPYSFGDTLTYASGLLLGDYASSNPCKIATPGRNLIDHVVGLRKGELNLPDVPSASTDQKPLRFIVAGDVMVSKSGHPIQLSEELITTICSADVFVINVESPVNFETTLGQRDGLNFVMSQSYLGHFVGQLKRRKPDLTIIYDIANNHALDGHALSQNNPAELAIEEIDTDNFALLRTVAAIRDMDPLAVIIGAHLAEDKYKTVNCYADPVAVIEKNGIRCGFIGFTDILNHNAFSWDKRVVRTEDIPTDLEAIKKEKKLDQLYLIGHGNIEQCIYPQEAWRNQMLQILKNGADAIFGHGPHVPLTNEVLCVNGRTKFIAHSLGNLYGPTKLGNTGLNCLAKYTLHHDGSAAFEMLPIEAVHNAENVPVVSSVQGETFYPHLLDRYEMLYPFSDMPELFSPLSQINMDALNDAESDFIKQLSLLRLASDNLLKNKHTIAPKYADKLYNELSISFSNYYTKKDQEGSYKTFKSTSIAALKEAEKNLSQNHQFKKIMLNLALAVITIGVGYLAAITINKAITGRYTFFKSHNLSHQLEEIENTINSNKLLLIRK
jgi:hypothetical protein